MSYLEDLTLGRIARILDEALVSEAEDGNVPDALYAAAQALVALGNNEASTPMGALEAHGKAMLDASENIAEGLHDIAEAIREKG